MAETIQASQIEIVDEEGRVYMVLGTIQDSPVHGRRPFIGLRNAAGFELARLAIVSDDPVSGPCPALVMVSPDGKMGMDLSIDNGAGVFGIGETIRDDGSANPGDSIEGTKIEFGAHLGSTNEGESTLHVSEVKTKEKASEGAQ